MRALPATERTLAFTQGAPKCCEQKDTGLDQCFSRIPLVVYGDQR